MQRLTFSVRKAMGYILAGSMTTTAFLLLLEGRGWEILPLHLCSVSGLAAAALALRPRECLLDFLWYLGMPGAALALLFPAPAASKCQALMTVAYVLTHALILLIPAYLMLRGMRPRRHAAAVMLFALNVLALPAAFANRVLGTDFLFLSAPPAGTPLQALYALGAPVYLCALEALMAALCLMMERLAERIFDKT